MKNKTKKHRSFTWYSTKEKEKGIHNVVDSLIRHPHYELERSMKHTFFPFCNDYALISENEKQSLRYDILKTLKERILSHQLAWKENIQTSLQEAIKNAQSELVYLQETEDYYPQIDEEDFKVVEQVEDMKHSYQILHNLYERLQMEISQHEAK